MYFSKPTALKIDLIDQASHIENLLGSFLPRVPFGIYKKGFIDPILKEADICYKKAYDVSAVDEKTKIYYFKEIKTFPTLFSEDVYDKDFNLLFTPNDFKKNNVSFEPFLPLSAFDLLVEVYEWIVSHFNDKTHRNLKTITELALECYLKRKNPSIVLNSSKETLDELSDVVINTIRDTVVVIESFINSEPFNCFIKRGNGFIQIERTDILKSIYYK